ncbi:MAG: hypothetical protein IPO60_11285 [Flavobacteriales bacterium]|mgnify:CR=1 FL=1|jgi:hypothetical protein|nr:hypothetical protein [Flavobacteriales bacterium]MBK7247138.1 hypothetical protein [Flavobacteriales bacterium]MBK9060223.1 hypothetical protein [Flavobacteriales bacterium]MBK9598875.1 hypothetical protein [Flavobacteriales bacterium]QQS71721.1 MAG: hypothetical protein IPP95_11055 [Flavobacteriales bacterium]
MKALLWLTPLLLLGCADGGRTGHGGVDRFEVLTNWHSEGADGEKVIAMDYTDAIDSGFTIPSAHQVEGGRFTFSFTVTDTLGKGRAFKYKLYYRNGSYKMDETLPDGGQHPLAEENFYGSWESASEGFRTTARTSGHDALKVENSFRIHGDPRDEERFFQDGKRLRWARNPRVGEYSFLLVVVPEDAFTAARIPDAVARINEQENGQFIEPYWYFLHGPGAKLPQVTVLEARERLKVSARPPLGAGIYVEETEGISKGAFSDRCGQTEELRKQAPFKQFIHYVDPSTRFANIPLIADVLGNAYTPEDHDFNRCFFPENRMVSLRPMTTRMPCETVRSNPENNTIELRNPASTPNDLRKENVGVRSRSGLMYGKYSIKCKLTPLLNDSDMWVGLTNAIWLIYQGAPGNHRRICAKDGFLENYYGGEQDKRVPQVDYAEIDFEILKTPLYCPDATFPPLRPQQVAVPGNRANWQRPKEGGIPKGMITVACTNWDMACHSPINFAAGCSGITHDGQTFLSQRWDDNYRALTQKIFEPDAELFRGDHYWFQIDWKPESVTWRIGPELDQLREVGYMDSTVTSISDVQMQLIVTQEFHNTKWWPGSPYDQGYIPFAAKDYTGVIQDVIIE